MTSLEESVRPYRPDMTSLISIKSYRPDYLFFPVQLKFMLANGERDTCVLKASSDIGSLEFESAILTALGETDLSVPKVKSPIFPFCYEGKTLFGVLLQEMDGTSLPWLNLNDLHTADMTCRLTIQGVNKLHSLTSEILSREIASIIPRKTLMNELEQIVENAGRWLEVPVFAKALGLMKKTVPRINSSLVFSNGDYNPLNFITRDHLLAGIIDFEYACFEDPHIGFAKFLLWADDDYGWGTGTRSGLVERYLFDNIIRPADFYIRVILRGLSYIHKESPSDPPAYMLGVVDKLTSKLSGVSNNPSSTPLPQKP